MSYALVKKEVIKSVDPRTYLDKAFRYTIQEGAAEINYQQFKAPGARDKVTNFTFSNANPIPGVIIDKKVFMNISFRLTFEGTPPAGQYLLGYNYLGDIGDLGTAGAPLNLEGFAQKNWIATGVDAPRCLPFSQICSTLKIFINNAAMSVSLRDYIEPLMRFASHRDYDERELSMTPTQHDQYQQYADYNLYGTARNVLGEYGEQGYRTNRGGFAGVRIVRNPPGDGSTATTAIVELDLYEPLFISPLDYGILNERGIIGATQFKCNVILEKPELLWSHDNVNGHPFPNGYSPSVEIATEPQLEFCYLTPKATQAVPDINVYPWYDIEVYQSENYPISVEPGSVRSADVNVNSIKLQTIPSRMYIYARQSDSTRTFKSTDTYAFIENLSIGFINKNNLLAGATPQQLFQMSCKNGCQMSWDQWSKHVGSVVCVDFSQDIDMSDSQAVGLMNPNLQLKFKAKIRSLAAENRVFTLYYVLVYPGLFNIVEQQAIPRIGLVSKEDVENEVNLYKADYHEALNFYGGADFFGKMLHYGKHYGNKAINWAREKATNYLREHADDILEQYGKSAIEEMIKLMNRGFNESTAVSEMRANGITMSAGMKMSAGLIDEVDESLQRNLMAGKAMESSAVSQRRKQLRDRVR